MSSTVFFQQNCPVCGRLLQILVPLLGKQVYCQHCQGRFVARDPSLGEPAGREQRRRTTAVDDLIQRAEIVLQQAADDGPHDWSQPSAE